MLFKWAILILNNVFVVCGGSTIVSSCFLMWLFFKAYPLIFPLLLFFFYFLSLDPLKVPFTWNYTLIHNSMFVRGVHYCAQLLPEVIFFSNMPYYFPLLKFFLLIYYFLSFFHLKFSQMHSFPKYTMSF